MEFKSNGDYWPCLPDAEYEAKCVKYDTHFYGSKTRKLFLIFEIIDWADYHGDRIFMAFNMPYDGKVKAGSKYYKTWCRVNGWRKPTRNAKMSPRIFLNKMYKIRTRTAKPTDNGQEMPKSMWYSVVDCIVDVISYEANV